MLENIDLLKIKSVVKEEIASQLKPVKRSLLKLEAGSRKTNRSIDIIVRTFDSEYLDLKERVESLEDKVGITR